MKHIILITDCFSDIYAGAEKQIYELAKRIDKSRFQVTIVNLEWKGKDQTKLIESLGCKLILLPVKRIYGLSGILKGISFINLLRRNKADLIMTVHFGSDIWGVFWGKLAGVRSIISNRRDMGFWKDQRHIKAYKRINRHVKRIIVNAQAIKDRIVKQEGIEEDKVKVIYNGIEQGNASRHDGRHLKAGLGVNPEHLVIVHVANIRPVKGHKDVIEAMQLIHQKNTNVTLVCVGENNMGNEIQGLIEKSGLKKNVILSGKISNVPQFLQIADICVLPSLSEGLSNAIMEYMLAAKPVVATKVGGNPELVEDGVTGILVEKENIDQLTEALKKLIDDAALRNRMGEEGLKKIATQFQMGRMVEAYEQLFEEVTGS